MVLPPWFMIICLAFNWCVIRQDGEFKVLSDRSNELRIPEMEMLTVSQTSGRRDWKGQVLERAQCCTSRTFQW